RPVEHPDDPLGHVADAAVGRFGRHGLELPVGDDQEAMLVRSGHQAAVGVLGVRNSDVVRSTAGSKRSASPWISAWTICRTPKVGCATPVTHATDAWQTHRLRR